MILPTLLNPESRGYMRLKSSNIYEKPIIQPNYLEHPKDKETMVNSFEQF